MKRKVNTLCALLCISLLHVCYCYEEDNNNYYRDWGDSGWSGWLDDPFDPSDYLVDKRLTDMFGRSDVKREAASIIDMIKNYETYAGLGAKLPNVITIKGQPGTGRTLLAKVIAGESGTFFVDAHNLPSYDVRYQLLEQRPIIMFADDKHDFSLKTYFETMALQEPAHRRDRVLLIRSVGFEEKQPCWFDCGEEEEDEVVHAREKVIFMPPLDKEARLGLLNKFAGKLLADDSIFSDNVLEDLASRTENYNVYQLKDLVNRAALIAGEAFSSGKSVRYCVIGDDLERAYAQSAKDVQSGHGGGSFFVESFYYTYAESTRFSDVVGIDHVLIEIKEFIDILKHGDRYKKIGVNRPKGLLLEGLPGVGKTLIARAMAGESECGFISVSGSQFVNGWVGGGPNTVRSLFSFAKQISKGRPVIIFIDEFDSLGKRPDQADSVSNEYGNTINELLKQMDGFEQDENILVVAATNNAHKLDAALVREGRFDRKIYVPLPSEEGRLSILSHYMKQVRCARDAKTNMFVAELARLCKGFSGAGLKTLVNEAAILAIRDKSDFVEKKHFLAAQQKIAVQVHATTANDSEDGFAYTFSDDTRFSDLIGIDSVVEEAREFVDALQHPEKYKALGAQRPRGLLFYGLPGTGKTKMARAIAGESGACFISVSASQFVKMYVGSGPAAIRKLFSFARTMARNKHCIIFFDELDAFGRRQGWGREYNNTLNELLTQMDGFRQCENISIIGATNNIDLIDEALLRDGRFDKRIQLPLPSQSSRREILAYYLKNIKLSNDLSIDDVAYQWAKQTIGYSGASLEALVKKAALRAVRADAKSVKNEHFESAFLNDVLGLSFQLEQTEEELRMTAYHEAGHALISILTGYDVPRVSILARANSLGVSFREYKHEDFSNNNKVDLMHMIMIGLGGRCAENLIFGHTTPGARNDLQMINELAFKMTNLYGMGEGRLQGVISTYILSDKTKELFDCASFDIVQKCLKATERLLKKNKGLLEKLANALLEKETLIGDEVYEVVGKPRENTGDLFQSGWFS